MPAEEQLRVAPSAVIHHFGSKENLLEAVLDEFDARAAARVAEHVEQGVDGPEAALLADADYRMRHKGLAALHVVLQAEHPTADSEVRTRFPARNRALRRAFAERLGADRAAEPAAFLEGALTLWLLDPGTVDLRA